MYKLSATDAGFLYSETEHCLMHVGAVQVFELPEGMDEDQFIATFRDYIRKRSHTVPYLTNRLEESPLGLDHPVWVRTSELDMTHHIYRVDVPAPGGRAELDAAVARIHERPLDRSRPLWEMPVFCGLEGRRIAYYSRVHHACQDGMSGQVATINLMDDAPDVTRQPETPPGRADRTRYGFMEHLITAAENFAKAGISQMTTAALLPETLARLGSRLLDPSKGFGAAAERAPRTRFNQPVGRARSFATGDLPLADLKAIGKASGGKLNDVFLSICGGALRRYLERAGELPDTSLLGGCPVSLRDPNDKAINNQVSMMQVNLGTHIADPVARLAHVVASSDIAKGVTLDSRGLMPEHIAFPGMPGLVRFGARLFEQLELARMVEMPVNVVISNVPGPRTPLYSNGTRMLTHYPVSIPAHGLGLNITVQSYLDQLYFSISACARTLPDADALRDDMLAAYEDLRQALMPVIVDLPEVRKAEPKPAEPLFSDDKPMRRVA